MKNFLFSKYDKFKIIKREITFKKSLNSSYIIKQKVRFLFFTFWKVMAQDGIPLLMWCICRRRNRKILC